MRWPARYFRQSQGWFIRRTRGILARMGRIPVPQQFRNPVHCATLARDGLVDVCDGLNNRIQVFQKTGTLIKEARNTLGKLTESPVRGERPS
jgi:hypothetical protein